MKRSSVLRFMRSHGADRSLFEEAKREFEMYEQCMSKSGSSCPIIVTGNDKIELYDIEDLLPLVVELLNDKISLYEFDYIANGLLMDEMVEKSDEAEQILEELGAIVGNVSASELKNVLVRDLTKYGWSLRAVK